MVLVLDGAAGTYLETLGAQSHPTLWSSGNLLTPEGQDMLRQLHRAYIDAGADVLTSTTYQASIAALTAAGLSEAEAAQLITDGVQIAKDEAARASRPVQVAAGLGPYGAYLSHGEEYSGEYGGASYATLQEFWAPRVRAALAARPDALLFETVPSFLELQVIFEKLAPLADAQQIPVWVSLSLNTKSQEITLADGTPLSRLAELVPRGAPHRLIGANCFDVSRTADVLRALQPLGLPMIVYPNSGETYDGHTKTWHGSDNLTWDAQNWAALGAAVIGGCCRTSPSSIRELKTLLAN